MEAYRTGAPESKPVALFELLVQARVTRKHLPVWVTRALAGIRPWTWGLAARLARTWKHNPNHGGYAHSKERGEREAQLRADVAELHRTRYFIACQRHRWKERAAYLAVIEEVRRLLAGGDWWKPRRHVLRATGEVIETLYLPEDTWSAQTALHWCVAFLGRLLASAPRVTEETTPRYKPRGATTGPERRRDGSEEWKALLARGYARGAPPGGQPELPAQS